jgi:tetratricopeptide (TPR) repeat protein
VRPRWAKGHVRRGQALSALCRYDDAHAAFLEALRLEAGNDAATAGIAALAAARARGGDERSRGNAAFGAREYDDAVKHYSAALA